MPTCLQDVIAIHPTLATLPESVISILKVLDDPAVGADKLVPIVTKDPALTANLLKMCNSSFYGSWRQVGSVKEALVRVGNRAFRRLVFTLGMRQLICSRLAGYGHGVSDLWGHSVAVAFGAVHFVGAEAGDELADRTFTAGLLHDVGKLILDPLLLAAPETGQPVNPYDLSFERDKTGYDHGEAGAQLLEAWNFPEEIVAAVRFHHDPGSAPEHAKIALALFAADQVYFSLQNRFADLDPADPQVWAQLEELGIPQDTIQPFCQALPAGPDQIIALSLK